MLPRLSMLFVRIKGFCAASLMAFVPIKDF